MINLLRKITPEFVLKAYHYVIAIVADMVYGHPSGKLIVIGVTGTKGKSTTSNFICEVLNKAGKKCALMTTANFRIGDKEWLNPYKQTMLGRFKTHQFLKRAVEEGCEYAVVETSSEGMVQYRHIGIEYNIGVFTGLSKEHIEAHGSFENYKEAKKVLFKVIEKNKGKIVANGDDEYSKEFLDFNVEEKLTFGLESGDLRGEDIQMNKKGMNFKVSGVDFQVNLLGDFNVLNTMAALATVKLCGVGLEESAKVLKEYYPKIGRMEFINEGQDFTVVVDYAYEPKGYEKVYKLLYGLKGEGRLIGVLGSCGGGRDRDRRPVIGRLASKYLDIGIVTNEDPYDDDPEEIVDQIMAGGDKEKLQKVMDRGDAIKKALELAQAGDMVVITGKGCEQAIAVENRKKIPWDDRKVAREILCE